MSLRNKKRNLRICNKGHHYHKSSDCPVCPVCERERKPESGFLSFIPAPARRALEREGITSLEMLAGYSEAGIMALHGMGPRSLSKLRLALEEKGLSFRK